MKIFKFTLIGVLVLIIISTVVIFTRFWQTDHRLSGKFQSDKEATIQYLASTRKLNDRQKHIFDQIYGHLTYSFNDHKIIIAMESHNIIGFAENTDQNVEGWVRESYYFVKESNQDCATIVILPSTIWKIDDAEIVQIEFDQDGFWVQVDSFIFNSIKPPFKEKFKKQAYKPVHSDRKGRATIVLAKYGAFSTSLPFASPVFPFRQVTDSVMLMLS